MGQKLKLLILFKVLLFLFNFRKSLSRVASFSACRFFYLHIKNIFNTISIQTKAVSLNRTQKEQRKGAYTMKKYLTIILAILLAGNVLTGCAEQNSSHEQSNVTEQRSVSAPNQTETPTSEETLSNSSATYEKLIAYKTENYSQQSVADFNAALASTPAELAELLDAQADVINAITPNDENYDFIMTTMQLSTNELYCEHRGEELVFYVGISKKSRPCEELDESGEKTYEFTCFADLQIAYSINSPSLLTIAERDNTLLTFKEEMQDYLNSLSEAEITDGNIRTKLMDKATGLINSLSTENMELSSCEISLLEINDAGEEIIQ